MSDPNRILLDLPKAAPEGEFLGDPKKILKIENQHLRNETFCRFHVKWKDYPEEEAFVKEKLIIEGTILILSLRTMTFDGRGSLLCN